MGKYLAFDIEIAKPVPDGFDDLKAFRPLGISCAATLDPRGQLTLWHGQTASGGIGDRLTRREAQDLVRYLQGAAAVGQTILSWNGLGFDFDILAEESGLFPECRELALSHVDMMFHFFCLNGYALALDKAAKGMGLSGKTAGMDGALVPKMWAEGRHREVLDYVAQDVRTTVAVAEAVEKQRAIRWVSNRGRPNQSAIYRWLTAREALILPRPDTSWMSQPWPRTKFTAWTGDRPA